MSKLVLLPILAICSAMLLASQSPSLGTQQKNKQGKGTNPKLPPAKPSDDPLIEIRLESPDKSRLLPDEYKPDAIGEKEIDADPSKYPFRASVLRGARAAEAARKLKLINQIPNPSEKLKKPIQLQQMQVAKLLLELDEAREALDQQAKHRNSEKSKRWLAHYDLVRCEVLLRSVFLNEYDLMGGKVRTDSLPDLGKGDTGWILTPQERMSSMKVVRDQLQEARAGLEELAKIHKETPWADLAVKLQTAPLGLRWVPGMISKD